ncbi:MAG: glycosyltransferase [Azospirillum sp.]|nr:glycosyltransferase [Azospirillum sp.]
MKILICMIDVFSSTGGGQTFIRNSMLKHSDFDFYYFGTNGQESGVPENAHRIPLESVYRSTNGIGLADLTYDSPRFSLTGKDYDVALLLDMASAVAGRSFDVVEYPDFLPFAALLPEFLRYHEVTFGRVVQSLHGALTLSIKDLWQGANPSNLDSLAEFERLGYRAADVRYGISARYLKALARDEVMMGRIVDPRLAINSDVLSFGWLYQPAPAELRQRSVRRCGNEVVVEERVLPDLNFVGRQDQIKGPDLFLALAANLSRDHYRAINLFGATVTINNISSTTVLNSFASNRGLTIAGNRQLSPDEITQLFARGRGITFITSRVDTFNLTALESLLNGCPTVISTRCGICDYLDAVYPGLPYIKVDPDDLWSALGPIQEVLADYEGARSKIRDYLNHAASPDYGEDLAGVYAAESQFDAAGRTHLAQVAAKILGNMEETVIPRARLRESDSAQSALRQHAKGHASFDLAPLVPRMFEGAALLQPLQEAGPRLFESSAAIEGAIRDVTKITESCRVDRIGAFGLLAEIERRRGNELLYAVYQLRRFRLSGKADRRQVAEVCSVLESQGCASEADAVRLIYLGTEDEAYDYLQRQKSMPAPAAVGIETVKHYYRRETPRFAVLVSAYNCAGKIPNFMRGLRSFTREIKQALEVIFVDSGSPDGTSAAIEREASQDFGAADNLDVTCLRTTARETIQAAWNRALTICRAPYITFLGVDEMIRSDALNVLGSILERSPRVDWVQGNAIICDVNEQGSPVRDVMVYDRGFPSQTFHYLDCCYMGWVGGLYRRSVHDRVGYYNPTFRAAGDNEFKNRALPFMEVRSIPELLGTFLNYPEERTTQSPTAELEDWRAWHLPRSVGGLRYAFQNRPPEDAIQLLSYCLNYRKSYMKDTSTDLDLAWSISRYLKDRHPDQYFKIHHLVPSIARALNAYRSFDNLSSGRLNRLTARWAIIAERVKNLGLELAQAQLEFRNANFGVPLGIITDNRMHQYQNVWRSTAKRLPVEAELRLEDLAGAQDLAEVLSACQSDETFVDYEKAWQSNDLDQLKQLYEETALDAVLVLPPEPAGDAALTEALAALGRARPYSIVVVGRCRRDIQARESRLYLAGRPNTARPVLAACRVIVLPYWSSAAVAGVLPQAITMLASGKPVVLSRPLAEALGTALGAGLAGIEGIVICESAEAVAPAVVDFLAPSAADRRVAARQSLRSVSRMVRAKMGSEAAASAAAAGDDPGQPDMLEWDDDVRTVNRVFHALFEGGETVTEELAALERAMAKPDLRAKLIGCARGLLVEQSAPILKTNQACFVEMRRLKPAPSVGAALAGAYLRGRPPLPAAPAIAEPGTGEDETAAAVQHLVIETLPDAWFLDSLRRFIDTIFSKHLSRRKITLSLIGKVDIGTMFYRSVQVIKPAQAGAVLAAGNYVMICPGTADAALRPSSLYHGVRMLSRNRPLSGSVHAFWFLDRETAPFTFGSDEAWTADIVELLQDPAARSRRVAAMQAARTNLNY